jgi:hypothetical protein
MPSKFRIEKVEVVKVKGEIVYCEHISLHPADPDPAAQTALLIAYRNNYLQVKAIIYGDTVRWIWRSSVSDHNRQYVVGGVVTSAREKWLREEAPKFLKRSLE